MLIEYKLYKTERNKIVNNKIWNLLFSKKYLQSLRATATPV